MVWTTVLGTAGLALFAIGLRVGLRATRPGLGGLARTMYMARGLRIAVLGLCSFAIAIGLAYESSATVGVALVIAAEETLEITTVVAALGWGLERWDAPSGASDETAMKPAPGRNVPIASITLRVLSARRAPAGELLRDPRAEPLA